MEHGGGTEGGPRTVSEDADVPGEVDARGLGLALACPFVFAFAPGFARTIHPFRVGFVVLAGTRCNTPGMAGGGGGRPTHWLELRRLPLT